MDNTLLRNAHLEGDTFFWEGGPTGVLIFHGFTATTAEVRLFAKYLHDRGYTVSGPLLPGHGTTPEDLLSRKWQDWTGAAETAYRDIAARCERLFVAGESMGGLLSLYLASEHPEAAGVLTYAAALHVPPKSTLLPRLAAPFIKFSKKPVRAPSDADARWKGYTVNPLRTVLQLYRLQHETHRRLSRIHQPLMVVQGRLDTTIDLRSGEIIMREVSSTCKEMHWLEHSTHCILLDREWEQAAALGLAFIEKVKSGNL